MPDRSDSDGATRVSTAASRRRRRGTGSFNARYGADRTTPATPSSRPRSAAAAAIRPPWLWARTNRGGPAVASASIARKADRSSRYSAHRRTVPGRPAERPWPRKSTAWAATPWPAIQLSTWSCRPAWSPYPGRTARRAHGGPAGSAQRWCRAGPAVASVSCWTAGTIIGVSGRRCGEGYPPGRRRTASAPYHEGRCVTPDLPAPSLFPCHIALAAAGRPSSPSRWRAAG